MIFGYSVLPFGNVEKVDESLYAYRQHESNVAERELNYSYNRN